ncbi:unnamed protein product, partial [marine sediment metagenome]
MSKELCEKLIKETELIYEIIKNNIFNDEDVINEDNKNHVKKWLWNSIIFLESEKETKTELYKQILKLEKNKQLTYSEVKDIYRKKVLSSGFLQNISKGNSKILFIINVVALSIVNSLWK